MKKAAVRFVLALSARPSMEGGKHGPPLSISCHSKLKRALKLKVLPPHLVYQS